MAQAHIMIVDDVESNRVFIKQLLQNDYRVSEAESGAACLAALEHEHPDLFLLDISMPDMDGYELCTQLRLNESTNTTPIIFVSAINSVDERLAAYEVGGDDFVIKPIEPQDLFSKIKYRLERHGQVARDREQAEAAMLDAVDAVSSEEETLRLADFVKSLQTTKTVQGVGTHICKAIESFGLGGCAVIFGAENHYIQCQADSLEARVLKTAKGSKEHVISIGVRTIICSDYVALLIKDMPIEDSSRYDRFIDHLVVLSSICDGRILTLQSSQAVAKQHGSVLNRAIAMTELKIKQLGDALNQYDDNIRTVMLQMIREMEEKLFALGLDEDQEEALVQLAYDTTERLETLKGDTHKLEKELGAILEGLYELLAKDA